jgi:hypothetical protein
MGEKERQMPNDHDFPEGTRKELLLASARAFDQLIEFSRLDGDLATMSAERRAAYCAHVCMAAGMAVAFQPAVVKLLRAAHPDSDDAARRAGVVRALASAFGMERAAAEEIIITRLEGPGGITIH